MVQKSIAATVTQNILRQKAGPSYTSKASNFKEVFKIFLTTGMIDIVVRCRNTKARKVYDASPENSKSIEDIGEEEFDTFLGVLVAAGVHRSNRENIEDLWKPDAQPIYKASMSRDWLQHILRFKRFGDFERTSTDKPTPIREILERLFNGYKAGDYNR